VSKQGRIEIERRPNLIHAAGLDMGSAVGSQRDCRDPSAARLDRRLLRPRYGLRCGSADRV